jgi:DNA-binding CsgD family transcriptional regulator
VHNALMITIGLSGPSAATLNIGRTPAHAQFAQDDFALGRALQPHLARAFLVAMELGRARQTSEALLSVLERSPRGLFLLGEDGRIRHANRAAEGLLGDGLTVTNGELSASASDGARRLKQAIAKALTADGARHGQSLSIRRPSLRRPLSVVVVPVAARGDLPFAAQGPGALVCIADPEAGIVLPAEGLRELFGFTAAEAAVALELLAGYDTKTVARRLALSVHTVRVHLSRIMSKTHTGRQAELMRLLMSIMGVL